MAVSKQESQYLIDTLLSYGIDTSEHEAELLLKHLELVRAKNSEFNLTRITDLHEGVIKHCIDSLLLLCSIPFKRDNTDLHFVDIGTGAGFPGVPLCITTSWNGTLVDSIQKKAAAVSEFAQSLELLNVDAQGVRIEDLAKTNPCSYDLVVARAVADISVLIEYASPLLKSGGFLCISKGTISSEEAEHTNSVLVLTGFETVSRETLELPENQGTRTLLSYIKTSEPLIKLPRRPGIATKRPLYLNR